MYKKIIEGKKAVFFDLDGTVVDNSSIWAQAFQNVLKRMGVDWLSDEEAFTPGAATQWETLIQKYSIKTDKTTAELSQETDDEYIKLLPEEDIEAREGFWDFLYEIKKEKKLKVALLTNSVKKVALETLKKINAENSFDLIIYGDEISNPKPSPEIYKTALDKTGLKPEEVLVFEDSPTGSQSASAAYLQMVLIWDARFPLIDYEGKMYMIIEDFSPLPGHLDKTYEEWSKYCIEIAAEKRKKIREAKASDIDVTNIS